MNLKIMYYGKIFLLIILLTILIGCDNSEHKKIPTKKQAKILTSLKSKKGNRVEKFKPILGIERHTSLIGNSEHPTIDGGIINSADGIPINNSIEDLPKKDKQEIATSKTEKSNFFRDSWATSEKVKKMLQEAAQEGKLEYVLRKTKEKGLPASVATIPMVESNYKNNVISSKGAAGVWQLMPKTAQNSGLSLDARQEFIPSTNAAINLLAQLYEQFGSWELAFAAYNAGSERIKIALQKKPQAQNINELDLPQETKNYVAKLIAINQTIEGMSDNFSD